MRFWFFFFLGFAITANSTAQIVRKNQKPKIVGQREISISEEGTVTLQLTDLQVSDPDDWFYPWGFTLTAFPGSNYTLGNNNTITAATDFTGILMVMVSVNDGEDDSDQYGLRIEVIPVNDAPKITGQTEVTTYESEAVTILLSYLTVHDPDNQYPNGFTVYIPPSNSTTYSVSGNQVIPSPGFTGTLSVPLRVFDGLSYSEFYALQIAVIPRNRPPVIVSQSPLNTQEDQAVTIEFTHIVVSDPDNSYPTGFTMRILAGNNYTAVNNVITPGGNYNGTLTVNVVVNDGLNDSNTFPFNITVAPVNDAPMITLLETEPLSFQPGMGPKVITQTIELADADDDSLAQAEVAFTGTYQPGNDELQFENTPNIKFSFDMPRGVLNLTGKAPLEEYTKALRGIHYNMVAHSPDASGNRIVVITVHDGELFSEKAERLISFGSVTVDLDIPTAFTPNGDSANDTWSIRPVKNADELIPVIRVYNKNGVLLFETKGFTKAWDGRLNGDLLPAGTYFYTIDFNLDFSKKTFKGIVAILR